MDQRLLNLILTFKDKDTALSTIEILYSSEYLHEAEKQFLDQYKVLLGSLSTMPSRDFLIQKFPGLGFEVCTGYSDEALLNNVELYLEDKKKNYIANDLMQKIPKIRELGLTDDIKDIFLQLVEDTSLEEKELEDIATKIEEKYDEEKVMGGLLTGMEPVDEATGGIFPGTLTTIMGYTGAYKTLSAINITYNAINSGKNVCYLSLEVPKEHLMYDILSRHSNNTKFTKQIGHFDMKKHKLKEEDKEYLFGTIAKDYMTIEGKALFLDESDVSSYTRLGFEQLFRRADNYLIEKTGKGVDVLIIDHAQLLKFNESGFGIKDPYQIVNYYTSFFRQQTLNFLNKGKPISTIILSQASREGYKNASKHQGQYDLTALAEANELERASQTVIGLYLDESLKNSKQVKIQVLKARDGATMPEPVAIFADPEFYIVGSDIVANPISMKTLNTEDLFNVDLDTIDFNAELLND